MGSGGQAHTSGERPRRSPADRRCAGATSARAAIRTDLTVGRSCAAPREQRRMSHCARDRRPVGRRRHPHPLDRPGSGVEWRLARRPGPDRRLRVHRSGDRRPRHAGRVSGSGATDGRGRPRRPAIGLVSRSVRRASCALLVRRAMVGMGRRHRARGDHGPAFGRTVFLSPSHGGWHRTGTATARVDASPPPRAPREGLPPVGRNVMTSTP